jgi:hypothetical protein
LAESTVVAMASSKKESDVLSLDNLEVKLAKDTKIKLAGIDIDGTRPSGRSRNSG